MARKLFLTTFLTLLPFAASAAETVPDWKGNALQSTTAETLVAKGSADWQQVWAKIGQAAPRDLPDDMTAVAVFAGQKRTGGYSVEFTNMQETSDAIIVTYRINKPAPNLRVAQVITAPYAIQLVANKGKTVTVQEAR